MVFESVARFKKILGIFFIIPLESLFHECRITCISHYWECSFCLQKESRNQRALYYLLSNVNFTFLVLITSKTCFQLSLDTMITTQHLTNSFQRYNCTVLTMHHTHINPNLDTHLQLCVIIAQPISPCNKKFPVLNELGFPDYHYNYRISNTMTIVLIFCISYNFYTRPLKVLKNWLQQNLT